MRILTKIGDQTNHARELFHRNRRPQLYGRWLAR